MKVGGHRYGAFLDGAATAAKLALYTTYRELNNNVRQTSLLYHVETKRVRAIVREVAVALANGAMLKSMASKGSYYLIALPPLWQQTYPCKRDQSRLSGYGLTPGERLELEMSLPGQSPRARILDSAEFNDLIQKLHHLSQEGLSPDQQMPFSDALQQHIKFQLLHSGTVMRLDSPAMNLPLYALTRASYSPKGEQARVLTMMDDVATYFDLLRAWSQEKSGVLRAVEAFDIDPAQRSQALQELDQFLRAWADKYHQDGGEPMVLLAAAGDRDDGVD